MTPTMGMIILALYSLTPGLAVIAAFAWPRKDQP